MAILLALSSGDNPEHRAKQVGTFAPTRQHLCSVSESQRGAATWATAQDTAHGPELPTPCQGITRLWCCPTTLRAEAGRGRTLTAPAMVRATRNSFQPRGQQPQVPDSEVIAVLRTSRVSERTKESRPGQAGGFTADMHCETAR